MLVNYDINTATSYGSIIKIVYTYIVCKKIYHPPQVLKDWRLLVATMVVTGTSVLLLLLETAIPQLRGKVTQEVDQESPSGMTVN